MSQGRVPSGSSAGVSKRRSTNVRASAKTLRQEEERRRKEAVKKQLEEEERRKFEILKYNITRLSGYIQKADFHEHDRHGWAELVGKLKTAERRYDQAVEANVDEHIQGAQNKVDEQEIEIGMLKAEIKEIDDNENSTEGDKEKKERAQETLEMLQHAQDGQKKNLSAWKRKEKKTSLKNTLEEIKKFIHTFEGVRVPMDHEIKYEEMVEIGEGIKKTWQ
ncbi:uncharacterized protein FOMMEDRAFT_29409 [Fomitiporia mediterranea MF3/22]|uniref:uncharacterized protein n=1 Tax=Fomitiporia mediterranea (strain MF3/22) TaxID=694068 RepID=UPI0004408F82|nr:uncharacterized protein FOMMEDRAFT_29409 [Fomitiporia mediterranea MF3/22]EJD02381.1 hypothetical protein FOMMEDRAFT_29409 [Fomitiporia mediterranea MF3/22]